MRRNKKGQFYIFLALVLIVYIASLRPAIQTPPATQSTYSITRDNFRTELGYAVNAAVFQGTDMMEAVDTLVADFQDYLEPQNVNMSAIIFIAKEDTLYVKSYDTSPMQLTLLYDTVETTVSVPFGQTLTFERSNDLTLNISGAVIDEVFTLNLNASQPMDMEVVYKFLS